MAHSISVPRVSLRTQWYLVFSGLTARLMVWRYFSLGNGSYCELERSLKILSRLKCWFMHFTDCEGQGRNVRQQNCTAYAKDWTKPVNIVKCKENAWWDCISFILDWIGGLYIASSGNGEIHLADYAWLKFHFQSWVSNMFLGFWELTFRNWQIL